MGKAALKALAAIGSGGVASALFWVCTQLHVNLTTPFGLLVAGFITSAAAWVVGKAVAASGPAPAPPAV